MTLLSRPSYVPGVRVLQRSLVLSGSRHPLVVLVTPDISAATRALLRSSGCRVRQVDRIDVPDDVAHGYARQEYADCWTKLSAFGLVEYDRVVLLDADMLVTQHMDEVFDTALTARNPIAAVSACVCNPQRMSSYPEDWTPANCAYSHGEAEAGSQADRRDYFNAGLVVLRPDETLSADLLGELAAVTGRVAFTFPEQDFLNRYFRGSWVHLPYGYNALKTLQLAHPELWSLDEIKNLHYVIEKPWDLRPGSSAIRTSPYRDVYRLWWDVARDLDPATTTERGSDVPANDDGRHG